VIADAVGFLRARLNKTFPRDTSGGSAEDLFVYAGSGKDDAVSFTANAVSVLLVRIEEETAMRPPDRHAQIAADGVRRRVEPEIRMNLFVLFVARFPDDYGLSLRHLSRLVRYFQNHRLFTRDNSPELPEQVPQLVLELVTPTFAEQNEIWGTLRVSYQPSVLYRVRMVVFPDEEGVLAPITKTVTSRVVRVPPG
jgi:hypothetical protein